MSHLTRRNRAHAKAAQWDTKVWHIAFWLGTASTALVLLLSH